jgi:hypothetical protein
MRECDGDECLPLCYGDCARAQFQAAVATVPTVGWVAQWLFEFRTEAHSNRRGHRMAAARQVKRERETLLYTWVGAGKPKPPRLPCKVTFTRIAPRRLDEGDNLPSAFKPMRDELARVLGLKNDAGAEVTWAYEQAAPAEWNKSKGFYGVVVRIEVEGKA